VKFPGDGQSEMSWVPDDPHWLTPLAKRTPFTVKLAVLHIDRDNTTVVVQSETCRPEPVTKMQMAPEHPFALSGTIPMDGTALFTVTSGSAAAAAPAVNTPTARTDSPATTTCATVRREKAAICMDQPFR
jgi:hypothetical protein